MKYVHTFPIHDADMSTRALIDEGYRMLGSIAPRGYRLVRCEWHRQDGELILLADAVNYDEEEDLAPLQWHRDGLIWRAAPRRRAA